MLFPTRVKVRISSKLSYPVGAELISSELQGVPQADSLEISFHSKYEWITTRGKPYSIFTVSYSGVQRYQPGWSITVHPVPRESKHAVKEALVHEMLPLVRKWLEGHADLDGRDGFHRLSVIFHQEGEALLTLDERRELEPPFSAEKGTRKGH